MFESPPRSETESPKFSFSSGKTAGRTEEKPPIAEGGPSQTGTKDQAPKTDKVSAKPDFEGTPPDIDEWVKTTHVEAYSDDDRMNTAQWEIGKIEEVTSEIKDLMNETLEEGLFGEEIQTDVWERDQIEEVPARPNESDISSVVADFSDDEIKTDVWGRDKIEEVPAGPAEMDATSQLDDFIGDAVKTDQWEINPAGEKPTDIDEMVMTSQVGQYPKEDQMNTAQWEIGKIGEEGENEKRDPDLEDSVGGLLFADDLEDLSPDEFISSDPKEEESKKGDREKHKENTVEPPGLDSFLNSIQDEEVPAAGEVGLNPHTDLGQDGPAEEGFDSEDFLAMGTNNKEKKSTSGGHNPDEFLESLLEEDSKMKSDAVQKPASQAGSPPEPEVEDDFDLSDFEDVEKGGEAPSSRDDIDSLFDSVASSKAQVPAAASKSPPPPAKGVVEDFDLLDSFSPDLTPGEEILESLKTDLATDLASQEEIESAAASPKPGHSTSLEEDLFEGFGNETAARASTPRTAPAKFDMGMDPGEMDALLSSLDFTPKDTPQMPTGAGTPGAGDSESGIGQDDLESLMSGAGAPGGSAKGTGGPDSLDSLLSSLESEEGGGRARENADSGVGADEIDDLMAGSTPSGEGSSGSSEDFHGDIDDLMTASLDDMGEDIFNTDSHGVHDFDMASGGMMEGDDFMDDSHMMDSSMLQTAAPEEAPARPARPAARREAEEEFDVSQDFEEEKAGAGLPFLQKALAPIKNLLSKLPGYKKGPGEEFSEPDEMELDAQKLEREIKSDQPQLRKPSTLTRYAFPGIAVVVLVLTIGYVVSDFMGTGGTKKKISRPRSPETTGFMMQTPKAGGESTQAKSTQADEDKKVSVAALSGQTPVKQETPLDVLGNRKERMAEPPKGKKESSLKSNKEAKPEAPAVPKEFFEGTQSTEEAQVAAASQKKSNIKLGAILPIELNAEATRILVVNVILELDSQDASKYVSERIPIYQGIVEDSIQDFFADKFYEETNYAQEKLQQFLLDSLNKDKRFGKVISVRLEDFKVS